MQTDLTMGVTTALVIYAAIALLAGFVDLMRKTGAHETAQSEQHAPDVQGSSALA